MATCLPETAAFLHKGIRVEVRVVAEEEQEEGGEKQEEKKKEQWKEEEERIELIQRS